MTNKNKDKNNETLTAKARYHNLKFGGGQITISKEMAKKVSFKNKDKLLIVYESGDLIISSLN